MFEYRCSVNTAIILLILIANTVNNNVNTTIILLILIANTVNNNVNITIILLILILLIIMLILR